MPYEVDRTSSVPIYMQLASWIEARITAGEWQADQKLPGEVDLAKELEVSRGSLRKAISLLIHKNLLVQVHGKGTFVAPFMVEQAWTGQLSLYEELMLMGVPFETEVLEQKIIAAPEIEAAMLDVKPGDDLVYLKRLRRAGRTPLVLHESFFPSVRFGELVLVDFSRAGLNETVEKRFNVQLARAEHTIAVKRANAQNAHLLGLRQGDPVLYNEHTMFDSRDRKVTFSKNWFRCDRIRMRTVVLRDQHESAAAAIAAAHHVALEKY